MNIIVKLLDPSVVPLTFIRAKRWSSSIPTTVLDTGAMSLICMSFTVKHKRTGREKRATRAYDYARMTRVTVRDKQKHVVA